MVSLLKLPKDFSHATPANQHGLLEIFFGMWACDGVVLRKWLASGTTIHLAHLLKI